jgi:hypothetical protein
MKPLSPYLQNWVFKLGNIFFLLGLAVLIFRNNIYPYPIKRASDFLFLLSFVCIIILLFLEKEWRNFFLLIKKILFPFALIVTGLFLASVVGYFVHGISINWEGVLMSGRFLEVMLIVLAIIFFQYHDGLFFKKIAIIQLSTAVYLLVFLVRYFDLPLTMARFQLFENWPSNVSYYLLVSSALTSAFFLYGKLNYKVKFLLYLATIGLVGLLLWTQSRGSWIGFLVALVLSAVFFICHQWQQLKSLKDQINLVVKNLLATVGFLTSILIFSFLILPMLVKISVFNRIVSPNTTYISLFIEQQKYPTTILDFTRKVISEAPAINFQDPTRLRLWSSYFKEILKKPYGSGLNYQLLEVDGQKKGPHNTPLELLMLGGVLTFAGFLSLLFISYKNLFLFITQGHNQEVIIWPLYFFMALTALVIASLFDNMSVFRLLWIIIGTGLVLKH